MSRFNFDFQPAWLEFVIIFLLVLAAIIAVAFVIVCYGMYATEYRNGGSAQAKKRLRRLLTADPQYDGPPSGRQSASDSDLPALLVPQAVESLNRRLKVKASTPPLLQLAVYTLLTPFAIAALLVILGSMNEQIRGALMSAPWFLQLAVYTLVTPVTIVILLGLLGNLVGRLRCALMNEHTLVKSILEDEAKLRQEYQDLHPYRLTSSLAQKMHTGNNRTLKDQG